MPIQRKHASLTITLVLGLWTLSCNLSAGVPATPTPTEPAPTAAPSELAPTRTPLPPTEVGPTSVSQFPDPTGYQWSLVADGLSKPVDLQHSGDSRLFIVEQRGVVLVLQDGQLRAQPFLDLRSQVNDGAFEQGLLGLAFHPEYLRNGKLYINYTNAGGDSVVSEFTASVDLGQVDPKTERVLLTIDQPFGNHNGGGMAFGPDGYLYIATGDGGSAADPFGNGQSLETLLGKLLRIDVRSQTGYGIPPDNPFVGGSGRAEIWAYGLRNPWRFAFDRAVGNLYIGDVGQNAWEEIDFLPADSGGGANFGWNLREGAHPFAGGAAGDLLDPVAEYPHNGRTCSVTGGVVVRSADLPEWEGVYIYGDYCSGEVWGLLPDAGGGWLNQLLFSTGLSISSFGVDLEGNPYLLHHQGGVYRLQPAP